MAAVGTVTLKADQYESMLEKIKQKTESASNSMSQSVGKVGSQVSKAGGVLKTLGASIGSHFGALGSVISSVTAGPIAMFTAAIGSLVAIGTQIWDKMTMSASEYAAELERISREAEKAHQSMLKQMDEDSGYMDRLAEQVLLPLGRPHVGLARHGRRRRNGIDGGDFRKGVGHIGRGLVAVHGDVDGRFPFGHGRTSCR